MDKLLIGIFVPAINEHFDLFMPADVPINELKLIISNGIAELTNGKYIVSGYEQLCLKDDSAILNPSLTLHDYNIKNGIQLYLI